MADFARDGLRKQRVLVVDDDLDTLEVLATLLRFLGHEPYTARRGREGLDVVRDVDPHLVMLDIALPDISGYDLVRAVRKTPGRRRYIAAATGYGQPRDRALARDAGFDEHLTKPILASQVNRLLQLADSLRG